MMTPKRTFINDYGPCPPSGFHRYRFHVFALETSLNLCAGPNKKNLKKLVETHVRAQKEV